MYASTCSVVMNNCGFITIRTVKGVVRFSFRHEGRWTLRLVEGLDVLQRLTRRRRQELHREAVHALGRRLLDPSRHSELP